MSLLLDKVTYYNRVMENCHNWDYHDYDSVTLKASIADVILKAYDISRDQLYKQAREVVKNLSHPNNITHNLSVLYQHIKP